MLKSPLFRQFPAYHDCRRGFNHNALLRVAKLEILCGQLRLDLLDNLRDRSTSQTLVIIGYMIWRLP